MLIGEILATPLDTMQMYKSLHTVTEKKISKQKKQRAKVSRVTKQKTM